MHLGIARLDKNNGFPDKELPEQMVSTNLGMNRGSQCGNLLGVLDSDRFGTS